MKASESASTRRELVLIRHGETRSNREGIFRGRLEIPLSSRGEEQARAVGAALIDAGFRFVMVSPLQRAVSTAEAAFPGLKIERESLLNNLDLGDWSGRRKSEIQAEFPGEWERWIHHPHEIKFPGGESLADVHERAQKFLLKFTNRRETSLAAVSHRSVIKCLLGAALGLETDYFWKFHLDNGSITRLVWEARRGFTLTSLNDTRHLPHLVTEWY